MERRSSYKTGVRIRRVDSNQKEIVRALRGVGASVTSTHTVGHGYPDLSVGFQNKNWLIEVKAGDAKLTPDEVKWHEQWRGQVSIVRNVEEALALLGIDCS